MAVLLIESVQRDAHLVTPMVGAVKALATVVEIADVMRKRFGEYHPAR